MESLSSTRTVSGFFHICPSPADSRRKLRDRLNVVGIIDPAIQSAEQVLAKKRESGIAGYADTRIFGSLEEAGISLTGDDIPK